MKYYAVGVPVGRLNEGAERYFFREGQLLNVNAAVFQTWIHFLHGAAPESLENAKQLAILSPAQRKALFEQLRQVTMLVDENQLMDCVPQRQGMGAGFLPKERKCRVMLDAPVTVSYPSYLLWAYCDGHTPLREVVAKLPREVAEAFTPEYIHRAVDELLHAGLLLFVA